MKNSNHLLSEFKLNSQLSLKNRIIMAPMTRASADDAGVPTAALADYYARRANAGLIITEGTLISPEAGGFKNVPAIYTEAHINGWKQVTQAVHQNNGLIFLQLWHVGRATHPQFLNGKLPLSASATEMTGHIPRSGELTFGKSRAATLFEIKAAINDYVTAAVNAIKAGFDGVEIHGANGYLIDQFLHYDTNHRTDDYGVSPENMARFALDIVQAVGTAVGYERVGLRLTPGTYLNQIKGDMRDNQVFQYLLKQLSNYPIAYVHIGNFDDTQLFKELNNQTMTAFIRTHYQGVVIANGGYSTEKAQQAIAQNEFNLVAIGRPFIANPDLIERLHSNAPLRSYEASMLNTLD